MRSAKCVVWAMMVLCAAACTRNRNPLTVDDGNPPGDGEPLTSIVYGDTIAANVKMPQTDIDWPGIADSPWPMAKRTPQCMARSPFPGPRFGHYEWETYSPGHKSTSGPVIGLDGVIYYQCEAITGGLVAVNEEGVLQWTLSMNQFWGSPMIASDGTIYEGGTWNSDSGFVYAINPDCSIKWRYLLDSPSQCTGNNIGLDGTVYIATRNGYLYAIHPDGTLKWKTDVPIGSWLGTDHCVVMSPDGETLYVDGGDDPVVTAIHAADGSIQWQISTGVQGNVCLMVDNYGCIYTQINDSAGTSLACIEPSGVEKWRYSLTQGSGDGSLTYAVMDWDGFIYVFTYPHPDAFLLALDYTGKMRWKRTFDSGTDYTPILCDGENSITLVTQTGMLYNIRQNGDVGFQLALAPGKNELGAIGEANNLILLTYKNPHHLLVSIK